MRRRGVGGAVEDSRRCHGHDCGGSCAHCGRSSSSCASDRHLQWQAARPAGRYLRLAGDLPCARATTARAHASRPARRTCWSSSLESFDVLGAALDRLSPRRQACVRFATGTGGSVRELLPGVARAPRIDRPIGSGAVAARRPVEGPCSSHAVRRTDEAPLGSRFRCGRAKSFRRGLVVGLRLKASPLLGPARKVLRPPRRGVTVERMLSTTSEHRPHR